MKQTNKFIEIGQIISHHTTGSRWIIIDINPHKPVPMHPRKNKGKKRVITAYCLYSGSQPDYWKPGQLDDWVHTDDLDYDKIWTII
tara:strand:- start:1677 stop:1934 length:258 start_codon:yes stop_codon:yes gene_type:complete